MDKRYLISIPDILKRNICLVLRNKSDGNANSSVRQKYA